MTNSLLYESRGENIGNRSSYSLSKPHSISKYNHMIDNSPLKYNKALSNYPSQTLKYSSVLSPSNTSPYTSQISKPISKTMNQAQWKDYSSSILK